ncbi:hypothetical protein ACFL0D_02725 [Thermoproteota archaeon]
MDKEERQEYSSSLEKSNQELAKELISLRSKPHGKWAFLILTIGSIMFALSIDYSQTLPAFLSLALIFWGLLFLYIKPVDFVRKELLLSVLQETNEFYAKILDSSNYEGKPYFFSPITISDFSNVYYTIPREKNQQIKDGIATGDSLKITPYGLELSNLIEKESKINFSTIGLERLFILLKKALEEDLELVKKIESKIDENNIEVTITDSILKINNAENNSKNQDYLSNSIACSIAKTIHKPVIIFDNYTDGRTTVTTYKIL